MIIIDLPPSSFAIMDAERPMIQKEIMKTETVPMASAPALLLGLEGSFPPLMVNGIWSTVFGHKVEVSWF